MALQSSLNLEISANTTNVAKAAQDVDRLTKHLEKLNKQMERSASAKFDYRTAIQQSQARISGANLEIAKHNAYLNSMTTKYKDLVKLQQKLYERGALKKAFTFEGTRYEGRADVMKLREEISARVDTYKATADQIRVNQEIIRQEKENIASSKQALAQNNALHTGYQNNLKKTKLELSEARKRMADAHRNLKNLNNAVQEGASKVGWFGQAWNKFGTIFTRVLDALGAFVVINAVVGGITGFIRSLIKSNQLLETLEARLATLIPDLNKMQQTWEAIRQVTVRTPFKVDEIVNAAALVRAYGVDINSNMKAMTDWAVAMDKPLSDIAVSFGKIANYSPRTQMLLSTRGLTEGQLKMYEGIYGDRIKALRMLIQDTFGGVAERISKTFEGVLSNISDQWTFVSRKLGQAFFQNTKQELNAIYYILEKMQKQDMSGESGVLGGFFQLVKGAAGAGIIGLIGVGINKIIEKVVALSSASRALLGTWTLFATIVSTAIGYIFKYYSQMVLLERIGEIQLELGNNTNLSNQERISLIEEELSLRKQIGQEEFQDSRVRAAYLQKELDTLKKIEEMRKIERMRRAAQLTFPDDYGILQQIKKYGLTGLVTGLRAGGEATTPLQIAQKESLQAFMGEFTKQYTVEQLISKAREQLNLFLGNLSYEGNEQQLQQQMTAFREHLEAIFELMSIAKEKAQDWERFKEKLIDLQNTNRDLLREIERAQDTIQNSSPILGMRRDFEALSAASADVIEKIKSIGKGQDLQSRLRLLDYLRDYSDIQKDMFRIAQDFTKESSNWSDAWIMAISSAREQARRFKDEITTTIVGAAKGFGTDILSDISQGLLFGKSERQRGIDDELIETRQRLIEIRGEKAGIQIIEDQEAQLLEKINELEKERAYVVLEKIREYVNQIVDKVVELGIDSLMSRLFPEGKEHTAAQMMEQVANSTASLQAVLEKLGANNLEPIMGMELTIANIKTNAANDLLVKSQAELATAYQRLSVEAQIAAIKSGSDAFGLGSLFGSSETGFSKWAPVPKTSNFAPLSRNPSERVVSGGKTATIIFQGPVYGMDDFNNKVDDAMRKIKRNII